MIFTYQIMLILHVLTGALALCIFWVPALTHKGGLDHKTFGRYYAWCMYSVALTGLFMALMLIVQPQMFMPQLTTATAEGAARVRQTQVFAWFLTHLAVLIWVSVLYGRRVIQYKTQRAQLKRPFLLGLIGILAVNGIVLAAFGLFNGLVLQVVFGLLGLAIASSNLTYIFRTQVSKTAWLREHLAAYIGSGIGAYTAFFVFGGRQLLPMDGHWQLAMWIAPGVIGSCFIARLSRKYDPQTARQPKNRVVS